MTTQPTHLSWKEVQFEVQRICGLLSKDANYDGVYGIPTGGWNVAHLFAKELNLSLVDKPTPYSLIVDDIVDSGKTAERFQAIAPVIAVYAKANSPEHLVRHAAIRSGWLVFPWEGNSSGPEDAVVRLLEFIGEDPKREGLVKTPHRVIKALGEMTSGYHLNPEEILSTVFTEECDELVLLRDIPFHSLCEHHMLPFSGKAHVGYIPKGQVVGLSKLARLVRCFSRRLQVQERMTRQIATAIDEHLQPLGVGVIVQAVHQCMTCRGVGVHGSEMITSAMVGVFRDKPEARAEFLTLVKLK